MGRFIQLFSVFMFISASAAFAQSHALIMHGDPKYPSDFTHLEYTNPDAPKGGTLKEPVVGSFDNVNHHIIFLAFDDAYYTKKHSNYSYINMLRSKLSLKKIGEPGNNVSKPFYIEIEKYLHTKYKKVSKIKDYYKHNYKKDIFFKYFSADRKFMNKMGMEEKNKLMHRFDAFIIG